MWNEKVEEKWRKSLWESGGSGEGGSGGGGGDGED